MLLMTIENKRNQSEELGICKAGSVGSKEISQAGTNFKELQMPGKGVCTQQK